ncbi:MAG TPA: hypothetical protein VEP69_05260, partial [Thermodesulfovibrionales bacterium]|nr:hypothetical protein [Thermodesulfovibrionales bacterium]
DAPTAQERKYGQLHAQIALNIFAVIIVFIYHLTLFFMSHASFSCIIGAIWGSVKANLKICKGYLPEKKGK